MISRFILTLSAIFSVKKQIFVPNLNRALSNFNEIGTPTYVSPAELLLKDLLNDLNDTNKQAAASHSTAYNDLLNLVGDRFRLIYPGTKWCGDGDRAKSPDDLGYFKETDKCCRGHDKCPVDLLPNKTSFGLWNNGIFTRSHHDCDETFYKCLKAVKSHIANSIGITYFDVLRPQSFKDEYPAKCVQYDREEVEGRKCTSYKLNSAKPKYYQWFDNMGYE